MSVPTRKSDILKKTSRLRSCLLATNERYANSTAEVTEWHSLVMGGKNAEFAEKYIRKGSRLYVEGKLRTREYDDRMKIRRRKTEIIVERFELLGRKNEPPA